MRTSRGAGSSSGSARPSRFPADHRVQRPPPLELRSAHAQSTTAGRCSARVRLDDDGVDRPPSRAGRAHLARDAGKGSADELGYRPRERHSELRFAAIALDPDGSLDASRLVMATIEEARRAGRLVVVIPTGDEVLHVATSSIRRSACSSTGSSTSTRPMAWRHLRTSSSRPSSSGSPRDRRRRGRSHHRHAR
jgi:hypothetical protein